MAFPKIIELDADNNTLEFVGIDLQIKSKEQSATYRYIKSDTKLGQSVSLTEKQINLLYSYKNTPNGTERDQEIKGRSGDTQEEKVLPNTKGVKKKSRAATKRKR